MTNLESELVLHGPWYAIRHCQSHIFNPDTPKTLRSLMFRFDDYPTKGLSSLVARAFPMRHSFGVLTKRTGVSGRCATSVHAREASCKVM
jgi:hypothetical protein